MPTNRTDQPILVKFMARMPQHVAEHRFLRQFPKGTPQWGKCRFLFDVEAEKYDWLAVYHDIHRPGLIEPLSCPREKTILITTEPSTITVYGSDYLRQFGTILTSQEPWAIPHPNPVFCQPGLMWFYGCNMDDGTIKSYDELAATPCPVKDQLISTVCSSRHGHLTLHSKRVLFTENLKRTIKDLVVYGHGVNPMGDKAESLDRYKYFITIENHVHPHHMTEKLPDAFLGYTLPFYHGCPNAADYFPPESFIAIDFTDFDKTVDIIQSTITNNEYEDRLPYIIEARRRVLEEHNLFALLERMITTGNQHHTGEKPYGVIMNRRTLRIKHPLTGIHSLWEKVAVKGRHRLNQLMGRY